MNKVMNPVSKNKRTSLNNELSTSYEMTTVIKGVCVVKHFNDKPLYKQSAEKILIYTNERKDTDIVFRQPPKEKPVFKEGVVLNVFKK